MLTFNPKEEKTALIHALLLGAVAPRPIAFASTIDNEGNPNLSPFSFFNVFSAKPPVLVFSPARRVRDNTTKHTLQNIEDTKEVVVNVVNYNIVQQASLSSVEYPKGTNEFIKSGLTPLPSKMVKPFRVKESPVQLECKLMQIIPLGHEAGAGNLIICEIVLMHIDESILTADHKIDPHKIDLVARMGGDYYCRASAGAIFEVAKPNTKIGIGVDAIPEHIRSSEVLTGNNLGSLGNIEQMPTAEDVTIFRNTSLYAEVMNNAEKIGSTNKYVHTQAKHLLEQGLVADAWKLLLAAG